jgi:K+-transporting ATPase ATPase C chain
MLLTALLFTIAMTIVLGLAYPLVMTGFAKVAFPGQAGGSLVKDASGQVVGSGLIGQSFTTAKGDPIRGYFQPRPSSSDYDAMESGAANLGPTNPALFTAVAQAASDYRKLNGLPASASIPVDAVTTSGSALDPEISIANARLQAPRVAAARGLSLARVDALITGATQGRVVGILGETGVNVLELNLALDRVAPLKGQ